MSDAVSGTPPTVPTGRGSTGGGGNVAHQRHSAATVPAPVTNQPLLALGSNVYDNLTDEQAHNVTLVQLQFARDVSLRASAAYDQIIQHLSEPSGDMDTR